MRSLLAGTAVAVLVLASCGGDDGPSDEQVRDAVADVLNVPDVPNADDLVPCAEYFGEGAETDVVAAEDSACRNDAGNTELQAYASYDCADGRTLKWNDHGWGYTGDSWHTDLVDSQPPQGELDACLG